MRGNINDETDIYEHYTKDGFEKANPHVLPITGGKKHPFVSFMPTSALKKDIVGNLAWFSSPECKPIPSPKVSASSEQVLEEFLVLIILAKYCKSRIRAILTRKVIRKRHCRLNTSWVLGIQYKSPAQSKRERSSVRADWKSRENRRG